LKAISLLYHDVVNDSNYASSGFPGAGASVYKLDEKTFEQHLDILARHVPLPPGRVKDTDLAREDTSPPVYLTFDDGGCSAETVIGKSLTARGWTGHFFVTGERINEHGFVTEDQIRHLHAEGHVIGSHSWSHPPRMSSCDFETLLSEWQRSTSALTDIIGEPVRVASVPGGFYSRTVAHAASRAGIRFLFTSEPTKRVNVVDSCAVLGRYSITRRTRLNSLPGLVSPSNSGCQVSQVLSWQTRKMLKAVLGTTYISARESLLSRRDAP